MPSDAGTTGESSGFEAMYRSHLAAVYGYFARQVHCACDAEDLTAQTFERAMRSWGRRRGASEAAWLFTIAHNELVSYRRRQSVRRATAPPPWAREQSGGDPADTVPDPYDAGRLHRALDQLPALDNELLALCVDAGMSYADAACAVGMRAAAVKMRVRRALERLRRALGLLEPSPEREQGEVAVREVR